MNPEERAAWADKLLALADDELILGQRNAAWCGHAPILEEDIAFANISLDEIGHAGLWYGTLADLLDENRDTYPDELIFSRPPGAFRNLQLVELPIGDWAFTIVRQYLFDAWEMSQLSGLVDCRYAPVSEVAAKVQKEETYHLRHSEAWVLRLGLGTQESKTRMQAALDALWPYAWQLTQPLAGEDFLAEAEWIRPIDHTAAEWLAWVEEIMNKSGLEIPSKKGLQARPRTEHSQHHRALIMELQSVVHQYPDADW